MSRLAYLFWLSVAILAIVLLIDRPAPAQESVSLTTPVVKTSTATYSLTWIFIDVQNLKIRVLLTANNGDLVEKVYDSTTNPTGSTLLHNLNTGNFTVNSLIKQIYQRLQTDGVIGAGTISGTPQ